MLRKLWIILFILIATVDVAAFTVEVHKNMPEEGFLYMETQGTNQMRWAADYIKAKAGGRYTGTCVNINYTPEEMGRGDNTQCGALGIERVGGDKPDFFIDAFWDDFVMFNWHVPDFGIYSNNFTSWSHFVNLLYTNESGDQLITNNHNKVDGYAYNATYGFPNLGIDYLLATFMNNSAMTVNLPNCTDSKCTEWVSIATGVNTNPATDYRQNGATTPVSGGSGSKRTEQADGMNYNCFSDTIIIGSCPDMGAKTGGLFQYPNIVPGGGHFLSGDEDWVIYEPATNDATFYYNELWLEGMASRNTSLQKAPIVGRYYRVSGSELQYFAVVQHWAGDMTQQAHIWSTIGFNHGDYESYADTTYGVRQIGGATGNNYENYQLSQAYANGWQNRYNLPVGNIDRVLMEQAFRSFHIRYRAGYDFMSTTNKTIWAIAAVWAVHNATAETAIITEKAVMDLRKCRNSATCDNQ